MHSYIPTFFGGAYFVLGRPKVTLHTLPKLESAATESICTLFVHVVVINFVSRVEFNQHDLSQQLIRINFRKKMFESGTDSTQLS